MPTLSVFETMLELFAENQGTPGSEYRDQTDEEPF